ncbi:hypothetical protein A8C56_10310 [Niabella ginsenosidivorans]|uniref:Uncharacterized protein n=1 Tax=Niabella ginsenosidivorans TaxID=1176587 RepID=A0A1A9I429_9BACT|nr:hypothetical protein A8C56_10310 [Niabella ginsenosidivorans]
MLITYILLFLLRVPARAQHFVLKITHFILCNTVQPLKDSVTLSFLFALQKQRGDDKFFTVTSTEAERSLHELEMPRLRSA